MPSEATTAKTPGKLIVVSGPSGVGKSTLMREALRRTGAEFSVSATTRKPRPGEVNGRDYYFIDRPAFEAMIAGEQLLEWAEVFGQLYGTPREPVRQAMAQGKTVVLDIDVQGGLQVHQKAPKARFVLILPPGMDELARRLRGRATEDEAALTRRLAKAQQEISLAQASGIYKHAVINDNLERAIEQIVAVIQEESIDT